MSGYKKAPSAKMNLKRASEQAITLLDRMGVEPLAELVEAMRFAKEMTIKGGNVDENGKSDQSNFLALWIKSASDIAKFRHPTLSAIAVKDLNNGSDNTKVITSEEAMKVIKSDPFYPKQIEDSKVVDAMNINESVVLALPKGKE